MTIGFDRFFDFLPTFDLGKLWSLFRVDAPVRPIPSQWRDKPIAWIVYSDHDNEGWSGIVFSSKNGQRLAYMPFSEGGKALLDKTRYLSIAPMDYVATATRLKLSPKEGPSFESYYSEIQHIRTEPVSSEDRAWIEHCVHPDKGANASADNITLG